MKDSPSLSSRFSGAAGNRLLIDALRDQRLVLDDSNLAETLAAAGEVISFAPGEELIVQDHNENAIYFILAGTCQVLVNGREVAQRTSGTHVGEMAAVEVSQPRSASVIAIDQVVTLRLFEPDFSDIAVNFPQVWKRIARELAKRLRQRNALVSKTHDKVRIFVMCSVEALATAHAIQESLERDPYVVTVWTDGVFKASSYPIEALEDAVNQSDFAIAIAMPDDILESRGEVHSVTRDNVIFELGFFMGRLGRHRTILLEPRGKEVQLPSDLKGVTTLTYRSPAKDSDLQAAVAPPMNKLRAIINDLGVN